MTELEREMSILTKDVAVVVSIQKNMQAAQAKTTENVDKLTEAIHLLSNDAVYIKSLEKRLDSLEESAKWSNRKIITIAIGFFASLAWFVFTKSVA